MSAARRQRRAAERKRGLDDGNRAQCAAERLPESDRATMRERERKLLRSIEVTRAPRGSNFVIVLAEGLPPTFTPWTTLPSSLRLLGLEFHEDTIAAVERIRARGRAPVLTYVDGWLNAHGMRLALLSKGGTA